MSVQPRLVVVCAALGLLAPVAAAQRSRDVVIRVRVVDTANAPVSAADVSVVKGLQDLLGAGVTDDRGVRSLTVPRRDGDYQVVVRKIGYQRTERFFAAPSGDTTTFQIVLSRTVQTLPTVKVTAAEDLKRKSYHADADDIATSTRPILDAMDVLLKLRPDMLYGRSGPRSGCGVKNVWVNGIRILDAPPNDMALAHIPHVPPPVTPRRGRGPGSASSATSGRPPPGSPLAEVDSLVWNVLSTIKPEHISEVNFQDCFDKTVNAVGGNRAVFIVLKPGVSFEPGRGSYVDDRPARVANRAVAVDSLPKYRRRLLGVFDESTGDPVAGVDVTDVLSGTKAVTTTTGTVALTYLPDGVRSVLLHKAGYRDLTIEVTIGPGVIAPITSVLVRAPDDLMEEDGRT